MAQLGRPAITAKINTFITENTSGAITATQMNEILRDIADSCFNIDSDESLSPSLVDVLSQGNSTQGNGINLTTNDWIYNEEVPFLLGYGIDGDKNRMVMVGADVDKAAGFFLQEQFDEFVSQMFFADLNTGSDHSFRANINGLEMTSDNSDYKAQVYITPFLNDSQVHNQNNAAYTSIGQFSEVIDNQVNDPANNRFTQMQLTQSKGTLASKKFTGLDQYLAYITVNPTKGVDLTGFHTDGTNSDATFATVKPEYFQAIKLEHRLMVDPNEILHGTGFYTSNELDNLRSRMKIDESSVLFESSEDLDNKYARAIISNTTPLIELMAGMDDIQSTLAIEPSNIRLVKTSEFDPNLVGYTEVRSDEMETTLINQTSPDIADHFIVKTWHSVGGVFTTANYTGLNNYSESFVFKDFIRLYNATDDDSIYVSIENGAVTFTAYDNGYDGQTSINPFGVSTEGSYISSAFGQGLGNSSSGFGVLWYDTPVAHTEPVMTIGSWNPETSTGIGMQISEYGLWSNMESSLDGDQYFLADVYLQNSRVFADNAAAVAGGLPIGAMYHTTTGEVRVRV